MATPVFVCVDRKQRLISSPRILLLVVVVDHKQLVRSLINNEKVLCNSAVNVSPCSGSVVIVGTLVFVHDTMPRLIQYFRTGNAGAFT
jgi:hypothetical protein